MIEETFKKTIKDYDLVKKRDKLLLGVSGGPDSLCMLHLFSQLREEYKFSLICVHFNHCLRKEADDEEDFIKRVCDDLRIKFISEKKDVNKFFKGDSLEQTARDLRFDFFLKCSRQTKIKKLVLAHHKDDLIETILMRMIRGAGLKGLRGFLPKAKFKGLTVIRPFIEIDKQEIIGWLNEKKIDYCVDKSNFEEKFFRNRIRMKLLPVLRELNPKVTENLYNLAAGLCWDYDFIYKFSYRKFQEVKTRETRKSLELDLGKLCDLASAVCNHVLRIAIEEIKGNGRNIESRHLKEIRDLIWNRPSGSIVDLPDLTVKKERDLLIIQTLIL